VKISISYPPIINDFGQKAMVSQNRNVQYFKKPTYLLPVTHAQAASILKSDGHDVIWDDGNAEEKDYIEWLSDLTKISPDVVVLESTTPVMNFMWRCADDLKKELGDNVVVIMTGYHSMRMPQETLLKSSVDIVLKSTHIDFALRNFINFYKENINNTNWRKNCEIEGLLIRVKEDDFRDTGTFKLIENLNSSEIIDRDLVNWKNYAYENGNFLQTPGTYATSVIRDCTFGKCTFCRYNGPDLSFSSMNVIKSVDEYENLINNYNVKEIFDDSGVWFKGNDAIQFCKEIIKRGLHKKGCYFGFNTRFEYLDEETIKWLAKANFRFVLIGLESGSEKTLKKLFKGYDTENVKRSLKLMSKYGLHPHLTVMVGYYWEDQQDLDDTISLVKYLMFKGYARSLQVTLCTPLDYTPYHVECIEKKLLTVNSYDDHDMSKIIVKTPLPKDAYYKAVRDMYSIAFHPRFILRQLLLLLRFKKRDWQFLFTFGIRAIRRVRQHMFNLTIDSSEMKAKLKKT
tara:strand:- start:1402 stop:2940 length:1539 start_codon:yes stop_codon:yes gene_type:complete